MRIAAAFAAFQFLYGAIKSFLREIHTQFTGEFQFLYGAIKRKEAVKKTDVESIFQFLYGAIKSYSYRLLTSGYLNFNSSMVRLKDDVERWV